MKNASTIGYPSNPLITQYKEKFAEKLQYIWRMHISEDIPPVDFLLFPDIHGILLAAIRTGNTDKKYLLDILKTEYRQYISQNKSYLLGQKEMIPGTNILLTLDFHNVDVNKTTHPEHKKNHVSATFGSKAPEDWRTLFGQSFDILKKVSPGFMSEIDEVIRKIIPFGVSYQVHNSGSYPDNIGHLMMSYPIWAEFPELILLEAILHEYNHNKLNLILQTEPLILNDRREMYYSPYRPDARHIYGIYLWLHAIAGAYWVIWNAHTSWVIKLPDMWKEKAVLYVLKNGLSLQVLDKYFRGTLLWKEILEEMRSVHQECLEFIKMAHISQETIDRAKQSLKHHYHDVKMNYPQVLS